MKYQVICYISKYFALILCSTNVINIIGKVFIENKLGHKIIVEKSTVPLGTYRYIEEQLRNYLMLIPGHSNDFDKYFSIISNPEFLAEG